jgi:hypothetical protein
VKATSASHAKPKKKPKGKSAAHEPDRKAQIADYLRLISRGDPFETRLLKCIRGYGRPFTVAGYWEDADAAAEALYDADEKYKPAAVYTTLNRIDPSLLARAKNRLAEYLDPTTCDHNILRRTRLLLDFDPVRPANISATDDEVKLAIAAADRVQKWLTDEHEWPTPIAKLGSGNGCHLIYAVDLPNDDESAAIVHGVLKAVSAGFSDEHVTVDTTVSNASRITKVAGTRTRKGDDVPERPHRFAEIICKAKKRKRVSRAKLEAVAALASEKKATAQKATKPAANRPSQRNTGGQPGGDGGGPRLLVEQYLQHYGVAFERVDDADAKGRTHWQLKECPFHPEHGGRETVIMQFADGKLGFHCFHTHCEEYGWQDCKLKIGRPLPEHYDPPLNDATFRNFELVGGDANGGRPFAVGLEIGAIAKQLLEKSGGWPKRVGTELFCQNKDGSPLWFDGVKPTTQLFAWIDSRWKVNWQTGADKVSQDRLFAHLQMTAEAVEAVEVIPHWPPLPGYHYMHPVLPVTDGSRLEALLDRFSPATHRDRQLMKAMILTMLWGGRPRARPAWAVIGPRKDDELNGRGVGKSILVELLGGLVGGCMSFSTHDSIADIKKRLLSPAARYLRVALLDNVKSHRLSWDDLEADHGAGHLRPSVIPG